MFGRKIRWIGASTAAAVGTLGVIAIMPANAATTSVTLTGRAGEVSAAATGTVALVATQRGDHLTVASDASLTLSGSCTSAKKRGDWFVAVCDTQFGDHLAVNLATPGSKLAVNARNMIASVQGSTGDDSISVRAMVATVDGGDGNDAIDADGGYGVHVTGGAGDDTIHVQSTPIQGMNTAPVADGGDGNDTLIGSDDSDHLSGGAGNDTILGGDGNDFIDGGAGSDRIDGGKGADRITGDTFASDPAARIADDGTDTLFYGKVKGDWSVTQDSDPNDGSRVDRYYWDDAHQSYYMDEVSGFEQVVPQPMPS